MKKRCCLAVAISIMFLLFLLFVFAATPDKWVPCLSSCPTTGYYNKCMGSGTGEPCCKANDPKLTITETDYYYCCSNGISYFWQDSACCMDNDGDGYGTNADATERAAACTPDELDCDDRPKGADDAPGTADDGANINPGKTEICNGIDDNCDGVCTNDAEITCKTSAECSGGTCNLIDENWETYTTRPKNDEQDGVCSGSKKKCSSGVWAEWLDATNIAGYEAAENTCDNKDNNCDGTIDLFTRPTTCGVGPCAGNTGTETCTAGVWGDNTCNPLLRATAETCNNIDDNCDGQKDEGCDDDNDNYCDSGMSRAASYSCPNPETNPWCCALGNGHDDCNDDNANINPGITENTNALCSDGIDNNCNKDNDAAWDNVATTGVDCKDLGCAGKSGPSDSKCCQTSTLATDCSSITPGDCGVRACTNNICDVTQNTNLCPATTGTCGVSANSCSKSSGAYYCNYIGNNDLCNCDQYCSSSYSCTAVSCTQPYLGYTDCATQFPDYADCACHGCTTCPSTTTGGSKTIGSAICQ